jgi:2-C-methyl-D-erythritol 4-phosphate cytidylyltransferase
MQKFAIIVAGGTGARMGGDIPKQFMLLKGKPVLYYSIRTFLDAYQDIKIVLVIPEKFNTLAQEIINTYFKKDPVKITTGGATRFHSVQNGLAMIKEESVIFVHDAVRCLLTKDLVQRCFNKALETGVAIPAVTSKDSIRMMTDKGNVMIDRNKIMLIQTPQTFKSRLLIPAFQVGYQDQFTDEATVAESFGIKINLIEGEENNIKITTPIDMQIAEKILESANPIHRNL